MEAFNTVCGAAEGDEALKAKVDACMACYDTEKPITGEVWAEDGSRVEEVMGKMGQCQLTCYNYPMVGQMQLNKGDKNEVA